MSTLYVVGTPIGNLADITLRAIEVLRTVDLILCEDTRTTKRLLEKYSIGTPTLSYHAHSAISRVEEIIRLIQEGKNIALVSDAGTPGISDPGAELVARIRTEMINRNITNLSIQSVPGPSAVITALSIAGVPCADFTFLGFLPHKKGRETLFKEIAKSERTMVFYESPHRIIKTLESLAAHCAESNKKVTVCRELTKIYEDVVSGIPQEVRDFFLTNEEKVRGEFVVIVSTL